MRPAVRSTLGLLLGAVAVSAAALPTRPHITGLAHYAIFVKDVDQARAFYKGFLGFAEPFSLNRPGGGLALTFIKINERQYIEIFPEREAGSDRLNHIAVETDDAAAMRTYLAAKGVKVPEKVGKGQTGNWNFNVTDPEGHTVEFVQYAPGGWNVRERGKYLPDTRIATRIAHVGIIVGPLEAQMKFYRDILGFRETWRGSRDGKQLNWVNMELPDSGDYIEFMLYGEKPAPAARGTVHHICLEVPSVEKAVATLETRPARRACQGKIEIRTGINRKRQANLFDADGTRTELMEPGTVDGRPTPSAAAPPPKP
jgi:catechol 2,3-dioxygenase-like lactoylglutathione lyase family enzyme